MSPKIYARIKSPAFWLAIFGALKLVTDASGIKMIDDTQVNAIANGLAAIFAVAGVATGYKE